MIRIKLLILLKKTVSCATIYIAVDCAYPQRPVEQKNPITRNAFCKSQSGFSEVARIEYEYAFSAIINSGAGEEPPEYPGIV